jgi:hypothetical protein
MFHYAGSLGGAAMALAAPLTWWWLLVLAPVWAYGLAWTGHFGFERNRPASWHSPLHFWWSFLSDWRMIALAVTGGIDAEAQRLGITLRP